MALTLACLDATNHYKSTKILGYEGYKHMVWVKKRAGVSRIIRDTYHSQNGVKTSWFAIQKEVLERDNYTCCHCGFKNRFGDATGLHVHHIRELSKGGTTSKANMETLCRDCHSRHQGNRAINTYKR